MPMIFGLFERLPVPSLRNYVLFSFLLTSVIIYYAFDSTTNDEAWRLEFQEKLRSNLSDLSESTRDWLAESTAARVFYFMFTDAVCVWTVINFACCALVILGKMLQNIVFGRLRAAEHTQMRDKFWTFVFHKFIFVFGVLNVQYFDEAFAWSIWFALCGFSYLLTGLAQDRFKYVSSSSHSTFSPVLRILMFLSVILFCDIGLCGVAVLISSKYGWSYGLFLAAECTLLMLRVVHCLLRYGLFFYDSNFGTNWEQRNNATYYLDFWAEIVLLAVEFIHYFHMLIWNNISLSMASLVVFMRLKNLYQEIDRRLRRYKNHQRIIKYIDSKYPMASQNDLLNYNDICAVCWDKMRTARKLTCGHMFHNWCLQGWLEQDTSCPTCRTALPLNLNVGAVGVDQIQPFVELQAQAQAQAGPPLQQLGARFGRHMQNHFFHFDGNRYARWLPSFSVEFSHNLNATPFLTRRLEQDHLTRMTNQIRELFPDVSPQVIEQDLRTTHSVEVTIDNILNGSLATTNDGTVHSGASDQDYDDSDQEVDYESNVSASHGNDNQEPSTSAVVSSNQEYRSNGDFSTLNQRSISTLDFDTDSTASRFSKRIEERESILDERKNRLIDLHRRRYIESSHGSDLKLLLSSAQAESDSMVISQETTAYSDDRARRRMLLGAAIRNFSTTTTS